MEESQLFKKVIQKLLQFLVFNNELFICFFNYICFHFIFNFLDNLFVKKESECYRILISKIIVCSKSLTRKELYINYKKKINVGKIDLYIKEL